MSSVRCCALPGLFRVHRDGGDPLCPRQDEIRRDGRIDLVELTRVIELYDYRVGTSRTGQYRVAAGTEDGFAPGPWADDTGDEKFLSPPLT